MKRLYGNLDKFDAVLIAGLLIAFLLIASSPIAPPKFGDLYFHGEAQTIARYLQGAGPWQEVAISRAPGPVLYYSIVYLLVPPAASANTYWLAAILWNALWVIVATLLVRRTGDALAGPLAGKVAALLTVVAPFVVYYSCGVAAESPAYLGASTFAYGWTLRRKSEKLLGVETWVALAGLVVFLLSRPNAALLSCLLPLVAAAMWWSKMPGYRREASFAMLCAATGIITLILASVLVAALPKKLGVSQQRKNFSDVMFFGSFQCRTEPFDWRFWGAKARVGSADYAAWSAEHNRLIEQSEETGVSLPTLELNWAIDDIIRHPLDRLRLTAVRLLMINVAILNSTGPNMFGHRRWAGIVFLGLHIFVNLVGSIPLIGTLVFLFLFRGQWLPYWALWAPWITLLFFHAFVYAEPRYMLASRPLLSLMAAIAICILVRKDTATAGMHAEPILVGSR